MPGAPATLVRAWQGSELSLEEQATHFVYAASGVSAAHTRAGVFPLVEGVYGALLGGRVGGRGAGLVVSHADFVGLFQVGGPIEERGRLRYIDGCTDSVLVAPPLRGEPCLNHLHIPAGTRQTRHTHPSVRVGVIARGTGRCLTPTREYELYPGLGFCIAENTLHAFVTTRDSLDVVVYHPETDTGPTHQDHPMVNRTIV
jgi:quercetin dioxygenase-like cupin family protein